MQPCTENFLGCMTATQWLANIGWAFIGGVLFYGYILFKGLQSRHTPKKLNIGFWLNSPKNWLRIIINTCTVVIVLRFMPEIEQLLSAAGIKLQLQQNVFTSLLLGLSIETLAELLLRYLKLPLTKP